MMVEGWWGGGGNSKGLTNRGRQSRVGGVSPGGRVRKGRRQVGWEGPSFLSQGPGGKSAKCKRSSEACQTRYRWG